MADYIYLLQNRLTQAQRRALEAIREAARAHTMPVFLVGGAARDLTSGTPVRDLDFAIQGDVATIVRELGTAGATITGENPVLGSTYLLFPGGVRAELAPTVTVAYPKPGEAVTQPATILDDLRRRDFTANAMAISLNEGSYGLLLDPLNGVADIENRELRLVSNYGFIEQPALALRIARLSERLGWIMEERTETRYNTAKEENYITALSDRDRGYEFEEIFYEEDPLASLEHLLAEGWGAALNSAWTAAKADRDALERVRDLMGQLEQMGISIDPAPVYFPLLTAKMSPEEVAALKRTFVRPGFVSQIEGLDARSKELGAQITGKHAAAPSETWKLLFSAEPEAVLWLAYSSRSGAVQAKFKAFLNEWPQMRQRVPYALMQEMRITPDLPGYEQLLDDLFFALLDGKLDTPEATRAFLEPYSPPAPVVAVSPRRRPAKATRSRSRKAAVEIAATEEDSVEEDVPAIAVSTEEQPEAETAGDTPEPQRPEPSRQPSKITKKAASAKTPVQTPPPVVVVAAKKTASPAPAAPAKPKPAPVVTAGAKKPESGKVVVVPSAKAGAAVSPAKKGTPPPAKPASKTAAKKVVAKPATPIAQGGARTASAAKKEVAKKDASPKKAARAAQAPAKGKAVSKQISAQVSVKATKQVSKAAASARTGGQKVPAKKPALKPRPTAGATKTASAKKKPAKTAAKSGR